MTDQHNEEGIIETRLRVLTWNIWWRFGPWEQRRPAIEATLKSIDADVIALQEVWSDDANNLAAELAAELGYHHVFEWSMDIKGCGFGNALLSRCPVGRLGDMMRSLCMAKKRRGRAELQCSRRLMVLVD